MMKLHINNKWAILKVIMQQASCLTHHTSAFSFTAEVLTAASTTAAERGFQSSWLWNHQMWGRHRFKVSFLFYHGKDCRDSSTLSALWAAESRGKRGMTQRWWVDRDQVRLWSSRWADFQRSVPPSRCRRLTGWRTPTIKADMPNTSAIHILFCSV